MEIIGYIWLACIIINVLYFATVDEAFYEELDKIDNQRFKDDPEYKRRCYLIAIAIICLSGPIAVIKVVLQ